MVLGSLTSFLMHLCSVTASDAPPEVTSQFKMELACDVKVRNGNLESILGVLNK